MKKIHMIAALLGMLLPTMVFGTSHYYAALKTTVKSGSGSVYAATSATSNPSYSAGGNTTSNVDSPNNSGGSVGTFYAYAKPDAGWKFVKWTDASGNFVSDEKEYGPFTLSASKTKNGTKTTEYQAYFELLPPATITFAAPVNGSYTVNGEAVSSEGLVKANQTPPYSATLVATPVANFSFAGWYVLENGNKSFFSTDVSVTKDFEEDATVGAEFIPDGYAIYAAKAAKGYDDLATALAEATSGEAITVFSNVSIGDTNAIPVGVSLTVNAGATVTISSSAALLVDGTLVVNGTVSGVVSKCATLFTQEGVNDGNGNPQPITAYETVKYWKTKSEVSKANVTGNVSNLKSHLSIYNGYGHPCRMVCSTMPTMLTCKVDPNVALNHITEIIAGYTNDKFTTAASSSTSQMILLLSDLTVSFSKNSKYTSNAGILDCAGKKFTLEGYARAEYKHTILNGSAEWTQTTSSGGFYGKCKCINCSSVTVANAVNSGANWIEFYDCTPGKFITAMEDDISTSFKVRYYSGGPYDPDTFTGVEKCYELYGGCYTTEPKDTLIASTMSGTHEFRQDPSDSYWYLKPKGEDVAQVGNAKFKSFDEAFTAAMKLDSATITLLKSTTVDKSYTIDLEKSLCIEFAGCKIVSTAEGAFLKNYGTLELGDKFGNFDTAGIEAETILENHCTVDVCYGAYTGNIRLSGGTFTTHHGLFDGSLTIDEGLDAQTVANIRGGVFTSSVANYLRDEIVQNYYQKGTEPKRYWVGRFPQSITNKTSISGMEKAWSLDFLSAKNLRLYKNASTDRSAYEGTEWQEKAELNASLYAYLNYVLDCSIGFDVAVDKGTVTIYAPYVNEKKLDKNLLANERYSLVVPSFGDGFTPWTFDDYIANVGTSQCGVADGSEKKNVGAVFDVRVQLCKWNGDTSNQQVTGVITNIAVCRYMLGGKKAAIDRNGSRLPYDSLAAAVSKAQAGETVLVGADTAENVTLPGAGKFTIDPYGFKFTGTVSAPAGCKIESTSTKTSAAVAQGVESAEATTYVVTSSVVAKVGEMPYESLAEAVAEANGAVVTLVADSNEKITLAAGQTMKLAVADGAAFGGSVVSGDATCHVDSSVADGVTTYSLKAIVAVLPPTGEVQGAAVSGETAPTAAEVSAAVESLTGNTTISKVDSGVASVNEALTGDNQIKEVGVTPVSVTLETVDGVKVVKAATFDVTPVDMAGNAVTTLPEGKSLKFRLPVDAHARATKARVFHGEEQLDGLYAVATSGGEKYVELSAGAFSPYGYELLEITADMITVTDAIYQGGTYEPAVTVKDGDTVLEAGTDYTVSYANNNAVGTGTVTVTGAGNYAGSSATKDFAITGAGYGGEVLPAAPVIDGNTITVTPENIQYMLDGAYGSIDGKTIVLSEGTYPKLYFARATKFPESGTEYYKKQGETKYTTIEDIQAHRTEWGTCHYNRTMQNVTFKPADGAAVTVAGIECKSGHVYGPNQYDYLLDYGHGPEDTGSMYYLSQTVSNITFDGLTFTDKVDFNTSASGDGYDTWHTTIAGVTFDGCTFNGSGTASSVGAAVRYYSEAATGYVSGLTVTDCTFKNWYQGVYCNGVKDITVTKSGFDTTGHNAIAVQTQAAADAGAIAITDNTFKNIGDRVIRFGSFATGTEITITGNTATNSGDSDGEVIKATGVADGIPVTMASNTWDQGAKSGSPEFGAAGIGTTYYMSLTDAIAAANSQNVDEITILNGATESPDSAWKVADGKLVRKVYVAQIGTTKYESLAAAVAAVPTDGTETTITMIAGETLASSVTFPANTKIVLDLNGQTIDNQTTGFAFASGTSPARFTFIVNGDLTVRDSGSDGKINIAKANNATTKAFYVNGKLTVESGTISADYSAAYVNANAEMVVNGGVFHGDSYGININKSNGHVTINGGSVTASGEATLCTNGNEGIANLGVYDINGGTIENTGVGAAIYNPNRGTTINIHAPAVITGGTGIVMKGGTLNVDGGTISGTGAFAAPSAVNSGFTTTGDALYVEDTYSTGGINFKPTVNITGGTFNSANGYAAQYYTQATAVTESQANGSINISGNPTLTSAKQTDTAASTEIPDKINIAGGSFTHAVPEEYCADGYIPAAQDTNTGLYSVKTGSYVAQIGTTKYETIDELLAGLQTAIVGGSYANTITFLADVELADNFVIPQEMAQCPTTFDLNGKHITLATGKTHAIRNNGQITLVDSVGGGSVTAPIPVINESGATFNMQGGTLVCNEQGRNAVQNEGTFNMTGGSLQVSYVGSSSDPFGSACLSNSGTATITKGSLTSVNQRAYAIINSGTLTINPAADSDVAVTGAHGAVAVDGGTVSISGGSYTATNYYALYVSNEASDPTVTVTGGTFDGNAYSAYIGSDVNESVTASVAISGGTFNDPIIENDKVADGSGFAISGGNFTTAVAEDYCATGYIPAAQDPNTGLYTVKTGTYVARNLTTGQGYESLAAAVAAASADDTVQLLADVDLAGVTIDINKGLTLDGDGHNLTTTASANALKVTTSDAVTIKNLTIPQASRGVSVNASEFHVTVSKVNMLVSQRGITFDAGGAAGSELNVLDCELKLAGTGDGTPYKNDQHYRGISAWDSPGATFNIIDCKIDGFAYDINVAGDHGSSTFNIVRTEGSGRAMLNVWSSGNTFNLTDCEINGYNVQIGPTEGFACIVENTGAANNVYNINGCTFNADVSAAAATAASTSGSTTSQQMLDLRGTGSTVNIRGNTTYTPTVGGAAVTPEDAGCFGLIRNKNRVEDNTVTLDATSLANLSTKIDEDIDQITHIDSETGVVTLSLKVYVAQNTTTGTKYESLQAALDAANDGDTIKLLDDLDVTDAMYSGDSRFNLWISKSITLDGDDHTLTVKGRGIGVQGASSNIDVTMKNLTVENVGNVNGRCVDTRGKLNSLTLDGVALTTDTSSYTGYLQPLTIGGNQSTPTTVTITDSFIETVDEANKGYAITTFNPVNMTITDSYIAGWSCLNIKGADSSAGSAGSTIEVIDSTLLSANGTPGQSNAYSLVKIEDDNVNVTITGTEIWVDGGDNTQSIASFQKPDKTSAANSKVSMGEGNNVTLEGDYNFEASAGETSGLEISGGTFNVQVPEEACAPSYIPAAADPETGLYTVKQGTYVAQIGTTKYESLAEAVAAANAGDTITMLADDNVSLTSGGEIEINKPLTITGPVDAEGKPLYTVYGTGTLAQYNDIFISSPSAAVNVTIENIRLEGFGHQSASSTEMVQPVIWVSARTHADTHVVVSNVEIADFNYAAIKVCNGTVDVVDCEIDCAKALTPAPTITKGVEVGAVSGLSVAPTVNILRTTIKNAMSSEDGYETSAVEIWQNSTVTIKDSEIMDCGYGIYVAGSSFSGSSGEKVVVTVENTTVEALESAFGITEEGGTLVPATLNIVSGSYVGEFGIKSTMSEYGTIAISGGVFENEVPEEYCAEGFIPAENTDVVTSADYPYTVKVGSYVAQIVRGGEVIAKYETFDGALEAAESGDTVQLLADVTGVTTTYNIDKTLTIDGQGQYAIVAGENTDPRSVVDAWGGSRVMFDMTRSTANVTFKDITIDNGEGHYYSFLARVKSGTTTFEDAAILHGAEADASGADGVGYGAAVQVDGGTVLVTGDFYADTHGAPLGDNETGDRAAGIFPFTAFLYQNGGIHFDDGVNVSIGQDLLLVGMVGALDVANDEDRQMVQKMLDQMNVPAGYHPYTLKVGDNALTSFTGGSPLGWNDIIDYGKDIMTATSALSMDMDPATTPVEVGLLSDTVLPDTFTFEDSNFTVDGNGYALSGTIEYTDTAGLIHDIVMGTDNNALVLDMTGVTQPIRIGSGIVVDNVTVEMTAEQATAGTPVIIWDAAHGVDAPENEAGVTVQIVDDQGDSTGVTKELIWDDEMGMAYIGPVEARLTGPTHDKPIYTTLADAIARAEQSGDTVTLMTNIVDFAGSQMIVKADLVLDGAGHTITAAPVTDYPDFFAAYGGDPMLKLGSGTITLKNITLDGGATHRYAYLVSADNNSVSLTTENVTLLHGGAQSLDTDGNPTPGVGYGAAIHLNNRAKLTVKDGFYADTHGAPAEAGQTIAKADGIFPFTAILPEGGSAVSFDLTEDTDANPTVSIGEDLLLVGMLGAIPHDQMQGILDYMKVPTRFIPYTLTLDDGSSYAFTGGSPRRWNDIIDYGKEIMDAATATGFTGLDKETTPVEVGLLVDTILPAGAVGDGYDFLYEDSNFSINGNGNALSGTIKFTDDADGGLMRDIQLGTDENPLTLDLRDTENPVVLGEEVVIQDVVVKMTEDQATLGKVVFEWDCGQTPPDDEQGVSVTVVNDSGTPTGETKGLVWDEEYGVAYIGPVEARLTGTTHETPVYTSLANALDIAKDNDKVELLTNAVLSAVQGVGSDVTLDLAGYKVSVNGAKGLLVTNATLVIADTSVKTNGTICAGDEASPASLIESGNGGVVNIPTGIFVAASGQNVLVTSDNGAFAVSGGYFSKQVLSEHCAESYMPVDAEAGAPQPYTVAEFLNEFRYPIDGSVGVPVERTWLAQNFSDIYSDSTKPVLANVTNALVEALSENGANEMPRWESYVLGLDPTVVTARLRLTATSKDAATVTIIGLIDMTKFPNPEGTTITFRLAEVNPDGTKKADIVTDSDVPSFDVLLEDVVGKELAIFADIAVEAVAK